MPTKKNNSSSTSKRVAGRAGNGAGRAVKGVGAALAPWWGDFLTGLNVCLGAIGGGLFWVLKKIGHFLITPRLWVRPSLAISPYVFVVALTVTFGILNLAMTLTPPENVDLWKVNRPASLLILDRDGNEIGVRGSYYGDPIQLDDLPPYVIDAFVATEDRRFFRHHGLDPRGLARATLTNLKAGSLREGASTITQQLARNLFLSSERSLNRKLLEAHLAVWLENRLSKEEILTLYLNRIYLGSGAYGIEAASQLYFSKPASALSLSEAALLAALPKAPSSLSPTSNLAGAQARAREVIDNLVETGLMDEKSAEIAKSTPPALNPHLVNDNYGYFTDYALIRAKDILGAFDQDLVIQTTMDSALQATASTIIKNAIDEKNIELGATQAALVAYNNEGELLAMVGGTAYEESQFNRAAQAHRQPGSSFKPFVYLAAIEYGLTPRALMIDQEVDVDGWQPKNYSGNYLGPIRLADAMAKSINTVSVQITEMVGRDKVIETARRAGIHSPMKAHPSIALGSMEVTLDEITAAYLPFARYGKAAHPIVITQIDTRQGETLYTAEQQQSDAQIMTKKNAKTMNHLLYQVIHEGTGRRADLGRRPAVGKTGTTNDWKDAWFIGYTAQITAGVWVGNDENTSMDHVTGGSLPAVIWRDFMKSAHASLPIKSIPGATPAVTYQTDQRLASFYNNLDQDFQTIAHGPGRIYGQPPREIWRSDYPVSEQDNRPEENKDDEGWVKGRPANEEEKRKPRRWFRFGH